MRGASLVETTLALAVAGLLLGMTVPGAVMLRDRVAVERQAATILSAWQRARVTAMLGSRRSILHAGTDRITVWTLRSGGDSVLQWSAPGPASDGVRLTATVPRVLFAPTGLTIGVANGRYGLERGGVSRTLVAARLGRLRVERQRRRVPRADPRAP
jgi:type II secretory pathway pseudopilin PulG